MGSGHNHSHAGGVHRWRLQVSFVLVFSFFFVELVYGLIAGSLALLSDAGHMAADVVALGAALVATRLASKPAGDRRTYGYYRAELFASGLAVLLMLGVSVFIVVEAIGRIGTTPEVQTGPVLIVGSLGLLVNLIALGLLRAGSGESINVKGAYLEVMADTLGSVGVIASGIAVAMTSNPLWDTVIALFIGSFVAVRAIILGREVLSVLGQQAPADVPPAQVRQALEEVPGVSGVHDLHVWRLTSGMDVVTAHLVTDGEPHGVLDQARAMLAERFHVEHATLQVEPTVHVGCDQVSW
ncbi:cation diffusion facilitator family transporter [Flexivirga meconopsidis]|uniref:cation diffusion facilitator family transporter n=1 Tax=Flexivirga meconopsidis TaxID=2977121 RepID=UPI00223F82F2|nr:cation diffusion facilitator family transporter [Flexivirga meconopsidis]